RRLPGALKVGISTHNAAQLAQALALEPDYVAFGPIFATRSKEHPEPALGMQALLDAASQAARAQVPLVAIGGLGLGVAEELGKAGVMAAVISDLLLDGDTASAVAARANAWQDALEGKRNLARS
ncbi:MAG TPA: thiamine phosphate synthase, partial [Polyangiaceae bacterium]|nr:thiamine phosphate synthase [Polyangiaceae bacterium]